jgi:hypothetical protein
MRRRTKGCEQGLQLARDSGKALSRTLGGLMRLKENARLQMHVIISCGICRAA